MLASAFLLLLNGAFLSLRLGASSGSFPRPLPAREERRCVERWMQGNLEARNTLIEHNLRLVAHIIKKYYTSESEQDDLISIGTVGLIKGVSTYRPDKGVRLATYASRCIENAMLSQRLEFPPAWGTARPPRKPGEAEKLNIRRTECRLSRALGHIVCQENSKKRAQPVSFRLRPLYIPRSVTFRNCLSSVSCDA